MSHKEPENRPSRYGRRLEDLSEDERAYYREFLPSQVSPAPPVVELPQVEPPRRSKPRTKNRWYWAPHSFTVIAIILGFVSFLVIPEVYSDVSAELRRNYVILWAELAMFFLLLAALLYGIFALAAWSDHDDVDDDRLIRPTDYAEQIWEKEIEQNRGKGPGDFYDSSWISGKK